MERWQHALILTSLTGSPSTGCVSTAAELSGLLPGETRLRVDRESVVTCARTGLMECTDRFALLAVVLDRGSCMRGCATIRRLSATHRHALIYDTSSSAVSKSL